MVKICNEYSQVLVPERLPNSSSCPPQETIVELLAFFRRVAPAATEPMLRRQRGKVPTRDQRCQTDERLAAGSLTSLESIPQSVALDPGGAPLASDERQQGRARVPE